jgi:S-DNA-T family DNA segregation ATPase FtsK/SpoIIIE
MDLQTKIDVVRAMTRAKQILSTEPMVNMEYKYPVLTSLKDYGDFSTPHNRMDPIALEKKLSEFGLEGKVVTVKSGPVISRYEVKLAPGIKLSQVKSISEDLAIALMSDKVRIQAPIPGTSLVGIEVANDKPSIIGLRTVLSKLFGINNIEHKKKYNNAMEHRKERTAEYTLPMAIGVNTIGNPVIFDLVKMPHLLIAGQTGSGKSVCLNDIIMTILYTKSPEECRLVLVDPKRVEMTSYKDIPHLWRPIVTEPEDATEVFGSLITEMESRYKILEEHKVRNIKSYNELVGVTKMPYIVAVVDEMADLMMTSGKELEAQIVRLAQLSRAVGIHLILATQKPIVKVITGLIKSNMPSRISFQVGSKGDSRVILDVNGAEKLIGRGDMLMIHPGCSEPERFHGAWVSDGEIETVVKGI